MDNPSKPEQAMLIALESLGLEYAPPTPARLLSERVAELEEEVAELQADIVTLMIRVGVLEERGG